MSLCAYRGTSQHAPDVGGMCGGCNCAWYCCREHQVADWKRHRAEHNVSVPHPMTTQSMAQQQLIGWPMMLGTQVQQQGFELFKAEKVTRLPMGDYVPNNSRLVVLCLWRCLIREQKHAWSLKAGAYVHYMRAVPETLQYMHGKLQSEIEDDDAKVAANPDSFSDRSMAAQIWRIMRPEERQFYTDRVKDMPPVAAIKTPSSSGPVATQGPAKKAKVEVPLPPPSDGNSSDEDSSSSDLSSSVSPADEDSDEEEKPIKEVFGVAILGETRRAFYQQLVKGEIENPLDARWKQLFYEDLVARVGKKSSIQDRWAQVKTGQASASQQYVQVATHLAEHMATMLATYTCGPVTEEIYDSDEESEDHEDETGRRKPGSSYKITGHAYALDWELVFRDSEYNTSASLGDYFMGSENDPSVAEKRSLSAENRKHLAFDPEFEESLNELSLYGRVHVIRAVDAIRREILQDPRNSRALSTNVYFWKGVEELLIEKKHLFAEFFRVMMLSGARDLKLSGHNDAGEYSDIHHPLFKTGNEMLSISFANEMYMC